jgi:hypothetical protein
MLLTFGEIVNLNEELHNVVRKRLPFQLAYAISKNVQDISKEADIIGQNRIKLIELYADKDENGNPVIKDGEYHISDENQGIFQQEYTEFLHTETEVFKNIEKVDITKFDKLEDQRYDALSAADITALSFMISEEKIQ